MKKSLLLLLSVVLLISCSNYSTLSQPSATEDISKAQSSSLVQSEQKAESQGQSSTPTAISKPKESDVLRVIEQAHNKACYSLTEEIQLDDYTIMSSYFIDNDTLLVVQLNRKDSENLKYAFVLYDINHFTVLKTVTVPMGNGRAYTFCSLRNNHLELFDGNKGVISIYDFSLNLTKEILLPEGYSDYRVALSADLTKLACAVNDKKSIEVYDTDSNEIIASIDSILLPAYDSTIYCTSMKFIDESTISLDLLTEDHVSTKADYNLKTNELREQKGVEVKFLSEGEGYQDLINTFTRDTCTLTVSFSEDYSVITFKMQVADAEKYTVTVSNAKEAFEPYNIKRGTDFSKDGESITVIDGGQNLYLITDAS